MIMVSFKTKRDKEHLLNKAKKMEEYARMIVECIEDSEAYDEEYQERYSYRQEEPEGRYNYRRMR